MSANLEFKILVDEKSGVAGLARFRSHVGSDLNVIKGDFGKAGVAIKNEMADVVQSLSGGTGAAGRFASALGPAGLAIGATAGLAAGATLAVFKMTSATAEAGEKFTDLSGKTGLSIETLSGLELQLKQSESSLDAFANAMFFLTKNQAAAREGNNELAADFRKLGVDLSAGPEEAIRQTVRGLSELTDVGERNRLGAALLGRGYKELSIFINDANGDLDKIIQTSREAGRVMTAEAAAAAAKYKDDLDELSAQIDAVERQIGNRFVPGVSRGMKNVADLLKGNTVAWQAWAQSVIDAFEAINSGASGMGAEWLAFILGGGSLTGAEAVTKARLAGRKTTDPGWGSKDTTFKTGDTVNVPEALQYKPKISDADLLGNAKKLTDQAREAAEKEAARRREKAREDERKAIEKDEETKLKVQRRIIDTVQGWTEESRKRIEDIREAGKRADAEWAARVADASDAVRTALRSEIAILTDENTHLTEINNTIRRAEILEAIDARTAAWLRQVAVLNDIAEQVNNVAPPVGLTQDIPQAPGQEGGPFVTEDLGPPPEMFSQWEEFGRTVRDVFEDVSDSAGNASTMVGGVFAGMRQGMEQSIAGWLLYGGSIGKAIKQMTAQVLAGLAAQAAVKAIFELAEGFASLFWNPPAAAAHFKAAALYGLAAVAAGVGAKAFAGGAASAAAGGSGGAFGSGQVEGQREDNRTRFLREQAERDRHTQREDRRGAAATVVQLVMDGREVGRALLNHVRDGGDLRDGWKGALGV